MSCSAIKLGRILAEVDAAWGLVGHQLVDGEQLFSFASLVFVGFYFSLSVIFLFIIICYYCCYYYYFVLFQLFHCFYLSSCVFSLLPFQFS